MGALAIATNGKFVGVPTRNAIFSRSGGDGTGFVYGEKPKPLVYVTKVRHKKKKKDINISVENIRNGDI